MREAKAHDADALAAAPCAWGAGGSAVYDGQDCRKGKYDLNRS